MEEYDTKDVVPGTPELTEFLLMCEMYSVYEAPVKRHIRPMRKTPPPPTKVCQKCKSAKPLSEYTKLRRAGDGLDYRCKTCKGEALKDWKLNNPEWNSDYQKWYTEVNREETRAKNRLEPEVKRERRDTRRAQQWDALKKYAEDHAGQILTPVEEYRNAQQNIQFQCEYGHLFRKTKNNANKGQWCPECSGRFVRELYCKHTIECLTGKRFNKIRPAWLVVEDARLELDMYNEELRLALEHQGQQHYEPMEFFGGIERFYIQQSYDLYKEKLCYEQGVVLLHVPYYIREEDISEHIANLLREHYIPVVGDASEETFRVQKYKMDQLQEMLKGKELELVSGLPLTRKSMLTLQCGEGHQWTVSYGKVSKSCCRDCIVQSRPKRCVNPTLSASLIAYNATERGREVKALSHQKRSITMAQKREEIRATKTEKRCNHCTETKPVSEFYVKTAAADGLQTNCKPCVLKLKHEYQARKRAPVSVPPTPQSICVS